MDTREFADAVGRKKIAEALKVRPTAVSNHVVRGAFPASWFLVLRALSREAGVPCPESLFDMRQISREPSSSNGAPSAA